MSISRIFCVSLFLSVQCLRASVVGAAATRVETYLHEQNTWGALREAYRSGIPLLILQTCQSVLGKHTEAVRSSLTRAPRPSEYGRTSDGMSRQARAGVGVAEACMDSADSSLEHYPHTHSEEDRLKIDQLRAAIAWNAVFLIGPAVNEPELRTEWLEAALDAYLSVLHLKNDTPSQFSFICADALDTLVRIVAILDELGRIPERRETVQWFRGVFQAQAFNLTTRHYQNEYWKELIYRIDRTLRSIEEERAEFDIYSNWL